MDLEVLPSGLKMVVSEEGGLEVRIYYLECLAQATYIISHNGTAFIVDPRRDVEVYIKDLAEHKLKLKGILETHFHADFVSGHCELARKTGATIYFGPGAASRTQFTIHVLKDGEIRNRGQTTGGKRVNLEAQVKGESEDSVSDVNYNRLKDEGVEEEEEDGEDSSRGYPYHTLVLDCAPIAFVDSTGIAALEQVVREFESVGVQQPGETTALLKPPEPL